MVRCPVQSLATARGTGEAACPGLSSFSCPYLALNRSPPNPGLLDSPASACHPPQPPFSIGTPDPRSSPAPLAPSTSSLKPASLSCSRPWSLYFHSPARMLIKIPLTRAPLPRSAAPSLFHHSISQPGSLPHSLQPPQRRPLSYPPPFQCSSVPQFHSEPT